MWEGAKTIKQYLCNLLCNNPALASRYFQYKPEILFKKIIVNGPLGKINIMLYVLNFKKAVAHMSICLYEFLAHQIFKMKLPTLRFLEKKDECYVAERFKWSRAFWFS